MPTLDLIVCDISPRCIELARERIVPRWPQVQFNVSNCAALDYPAGNFDCVCGCSILHHLPLRETLVELLRVLRPGGIIWFSEPNMLNPQIALQKNVRFIGRWLEDTEDETAFFRWPLARHLRDAGFEDVQIRPFDFLHPATPASLLAAMNPIARAAERVPVLREIAGSLVIAARKPAHA